jgi:hypothetical protein
MTARNLILAGVLLLCACDGDDARGGRAVRADRGGPPTVERDSAGVVIVDNGAPEWTESSAWVLSDSAVLRIGAVDSGEPAAEFARVRDAVRLSDGRIVIVEKQSNEIRWFAADGTHLFTRGGPGKGPGEFTAIIQLLRMPGDTIVAQDAPLMKHVFYAPDGAFVREERPDYRKYRSYGLWLECLTLTLPDRSLLGCLEEEGLHSRFVYREGLQRTIHRYAIVPWDMSSKHSLGLHGGIEQFGFRRSDGELGYIGHAFHARTHVAAGRTSGPDSMRVAIALNPEYSIEMWRTDGTLDRIIRRVYGRRTATRDEEERALDVLRLYERPGASLNHGLSQMTIPDSVPAVSDLVIGAQGELWVGRGLGLWTDPQSLYDVFDARGHFLGDVVLPTNSRIVDAGLDYLLVIRHDVDDVPFIEMYGLDRRLPRGEIAR